MQALRINAPYFKPSSTRTALVTLPRELRLRILEHTDLITPWKEVSWSRHARCYGVFPTGCAESQGLTSPPDIHHGCQFSQCWFNESNEPWIGCFCRGRHAAFSSTCKCWVPPGPDLFLVCRTLCRDAQLVFFSGNRFVVHDYSSGVPTSVPRYSQLGQPAQGDTSTGFYPYERLGASLFLRDVVPTHCLSYLRFLELVFPPYDPRTWPQAEHPALRDWRATISWLRDKINAPGLTLRLVMADCTEDGWEPPERSSMTVPEGNAVLAAYRGILSPLKQLAAGDDGLARFYADLTCPWRWTQATIDRAGQLGGWQWEFDRDEERKRAAECEVMGGRYESLYADGILEPERSIWRVVCYSYHGVFATG